jgi:hypothetical protein
MEDLKLPEKEARPFVAANAQRRSNRGFATSGAIFVRRHKRRSKACRTTVVALPFASSA